MSIFSPRNVIRRVWYVLAKTDIDNEMRLDIFLVAHTKLRYRFIIQPTVQPQTPVHLRIRNCYEWLNQMFVLTRVNVRARYFSKY